MDVSFDLSDLGLALKRLHRFPEAISTLEAALALRREVSAADPGDARAQMAVGRTLERLASAHESAGHLDRAIDSSREATLMMAAVRLRDPSNQTILKEFCLASVRLGELYRLRTAGRHAAANAADWRAARSAFERAAQLQREFSSTVSFSPDERQTLQSIPTALQECQRMLTQRP